MFVDIIPSGTHRLNCNSSANILDYAACKKRKIVIHNACYKIVNGVKLLIGAVTMDNAHIKIVNDDSSNCACVFCVKQAVTVVVGKTVLCHS